MRRSTNHLERTSGQLKLALFLGFSRQLFASYQKGQEATVGLSSRRHTGHNVRRFTGTALIMSNQLPEEEQRDPDTILETAEPASNTSLTPGTSFNTSPSVE